MAPTAERALARGAQGDEGPAARGGAGAGAVCSAGVDVDARDETRGAAAAEEEMAPSPGGEEEEGGAEEEAREVVMLRTCQHKAPPGPGPTPPPPPSARDRSP